MSKTNLLLAITNSIWLIEPNAIINLGPQVKNILDNPTSFIGKEVSINPISISPNGEISMSANGEAFSNSKPLSTAIIPINGVIMKNDGFCGEAGTATLAQIIKHADANPNIGSIVLKIDTPGGMVSGTEYIASVVKNTKKPIVTYVDGLMASAGYWIGSQADEIYTGDKTAHIGSIGTMASFADVQPMWEKKGVVFHEIYASASTDKNKNYLEARQGNYDLLKKNLDEINSVFLASVKSARGEKLNTAETLTGKVFMADKAIELGLIDGIKTFEQTVARAQELAQKSQSNNQSNINQTENPMKIKSAWTAMIAFLSASFPDVKADATITEEMAEKMNEQIGSLATVKANYDQEKAVSTQATKDLGTANARIKELETENTNLKSENQTLSGKSAGASVTQKNGDDVVESNDDQFSFVSETDDEVKKLRTQLGYKQAK